MKLFRPNITETSPRLIDNDALEFLTRTHPIVVAVLYVPVCMAITSYGLVTYPRTSVISVALFLIGVCAWTLAEYCLHRFIMHWTPSAAWGPAFHFWVHRIHHDCPADPLRLVMPPVISIPLWVVFFAVWRLLLGNAAYTFMGGFTIGYVLYDLSHYYFHHFHPRSKMLKRWQRHHLLHHYSDRHEHSHYAVSLPLWDRWFGTTERDEL